jgi:hypothetical protein
LRSRFPYCPFQKCDMARKRSECSGCSRTIAFAWRVGRRMTRASPARHTAVARRRASSPEVLAVIIVLQKRGPNCQWSRTVFAATCLDGVAATAKRSHSNSASRYSLVCCSNDAGRGRRGTPTQTAQQGETVLTSLSTRSPSLLTALIHDTHTPHTDTHTDGDWSRELADSSAAAHIRYIG